MDPTKQWRSLGEAASAAEAEALLAVRALLPDDAVTHAWANLSFIDLQGRTAEVDLLLLSKVGFFVVELKGWHGTIAGDQQNWRITSPSGQVQHERNPYFATEQKAKRLRSLLEQVQPNQQAAKQVPYVGALVVLHGRGSKVALPGTAATGVVALDGFDVEGLPVLLSQFLTTPPANAHHLIDGPRATQIRTVIQHAGFTPTPKNRYVGQYSLEKADPLQTGPSWQDLLAVHPAAPNVRRRVRVFDVPPGASAEHRQQVELAARREFVFTQGIQHPGFACPLELVTTDSGPALIFDYDDAEIPLDAYLADAGRALGVDQRLELVRQLADVLRYAHHRRLVHRGLTPAQVYVNTRESRPRLVVRDWQTGRREGGSGTGAARPAPTATSFGVTDVRALIGQADWVYLAPESHNGAEGLPPVPLDVYGLGALSYLILTGEAPAAGLGELQQRLESAGCLDPQAVATTMPDSLADLVRQATRRVEADRTASIDAFLAQLNQVEDELTAPAKDAPVEDRVRAQDPLTAAAGEVIGDRFVVVERRGTGSTGTALLVDDYDGDATGLILKLAKDDAAARRLAQEAEVLAQLDHPRVVHLLDDPIEVDGRTGLLLSDAGKDTLAGWLETKGRATLQELERFGADVMEAVAYLDSRGVFHRDIKPANLGIQPDPGTRKPRLVLFDLSLAREPLENVTSGTRGYVDPFIALSTGAKGKARRRYDRAAELYAVAVTLFEMATAQLPWWREGELVPASLTDRPVIVPEMFEPSVAGALTEFFSTALAPDVADRFADVAALAQAWRRVFAAVDAPGDDGDDDARDAAAEAATLDTPLVKAGLSARALSALSRVQARTVGELIRTSPIQLNSIPGMGEQYRKEVQRRVRQWRARLLATSTGSTDQGGAPGAEDRSVEAVLTRLIPRVTAGNETEVAALRLLLGMPLGGERPDAGATADWWPSATEIADRVGVTRARVSQILEAAATRWQRSSTVKAVRAEVLEALTAEEGLAALPEVASALLLRHGSMAEGEARLRRAAGLLRVVVESDARSAEPTLAVRRPRGEGPVLIARAVDATVPADAVLDDAQRLGKAADRLLGDQQVVPASAARGALRAVTLRAAELSDDRLLRLAAAASGEARLSSFHELYRPTIDVAEAAATALRGVSVPHLTEAGVRRRVASRFPDLPPMPARPALDALVEGALPGMRWDGTRYARPTQGLSSAASSSVFTRAATDPPDVVDAYLRASLARSSAVTVCVRPSRYADAAAALPGLYGVQPVDVAAELIAAVRATAEQDDVSWELVLQTDAEPGSPDWPTLRDLVRDAFVPAWTKLMADPRPLLLVNAAPLARYELSDLLSTLFDQARPRPAARWLLVPRKGSSAVPTLDGRPFPMGADRWVDLPDLSTLRPEVPA